MTIEADILSSLDNHAGLSALVGSRNYAIQLPQNPTYPNTVFYRVDTNPLNALTGRNSLTNALFRVDVRAEDYTTAQDVATQVTTAMETSALFNAIYQTQNDVQYADDVETYRIVIDFSVWFYQ